MHEIIIPNRNTHPEKRNAVTLQLPLLTDTPVGSGMVQRRIS